MNLSKAIKIHLGVILVLYFLAVFAGVLSPYDPSYSPPTGKVSYQPPVKWSFNFGEGLYFQSQTVRLDLEKYQRQFTLSPEHCKVKLFTSHNNQFKLIGSPNCPDQLNILGTDKLGRDYLSRLLYGLRPSLYTAVLGVIIAFPIGIIYGTIAGYYKDSIGELMMRLVEVILSLPSLYLLVVLAGILPPSLSNMQRLIMITIILSFIGWAGLARVVRGQVLSLTEREFVQSAILTGSPTWKIFLRELIPQLSSYLIITLTISFPGYVLGETALSFLGLGISEPDSSLGSLLAEGKELRNLYLRPWLAIIPSTIIILLAWNCNMLGDNLRNLFDPKSDN